MFKEKILAKKNWANYKIVMKRKLYNDLMEWKVSMSRKPLLVKGARQVGKSYLLKEFGKREFPCCHVFNFEQDKRLNQIFKPDLLPHRIISELSIYLEKKININNDLVIFYEIQEHPEAITSLKYFYEDMQNLTLCCAGSLIGVKMSSGSFPVGKVNFLNLYPMSFDEFLIASNDKISLELFNTALTGDLQSDIAHAKLWDRLKEYYMTGGMPKVVSSYLLNRESRLEAMNNARTIQQELLEGYFKDFAKHSGKINSLHIVSVLENIPIQLSNNINGSVKRYRFKKVISHKKSFSDLQGPIDWLINAGLIIKVKICNRAELPLETFCKNNIFKLFIFDIGLLGAMLDLPPKAIISQDFGIAKGYFAENYVAQEFLAAGISNLYSWSERNSEIEFLRVGDENIIPVEVKSGTRTQAKSLGQFIKKYSPVKAITLTGRPLNKAPGLKVTNYPLYLAGKILQSSLIFASFFITLF